jgi:hypothetical protein
MSYSAAVAIAYVEEPRVEVIVAPGPRRNSMCAEVKAVDICLSEWGKWMKNADRVLGWQTCNVLGKVRVEGLDGAAQANAPTTIPDGIMATDAAIAKLRDIRQQVIKIAYLYLPEASRDVQRRRLRMSAHRWDRLLREARLAVATQLGL